jgi:crotonobetainyl-CoA:carnitine CoA-transferase CaiB-like acyl-CoA transferase
VKVDGYSSQFGQHTEGVLLDVCGYSREQIQELKKEDVI